MIEALPPVAIEGHEPSVAAGADHPMRQVTRRAAGLDDGGWTGETRAQVTQTFDELAGDWHTRVTPQRNAVVADALARGLPAGRLDGLAVEVGSGIGTYTAMLAERFDVVVAVDLSLEMLRHAPADPGPRVQADAAQLPLPDRAAGAVVLVNALLFPAEVDRVLRPDGWVLWVNSSGERTPIHLPTADVLRALPGRWEGRESRAGIGTWCALRRTIPT